MTGGGAERDPLEEPVSYLAPDGTPLSGEEQPSVGDDVLLSIYEWLVFARRFDERATSLQRQGRIATWAPLAGQEGSQVASAVAMAEADYLYPTYRDNAAKAVRGVDPAAILARLRGHEAAPSLDAGDRVLPESIPVASHLPHAVGGAVATERRGDAAVHVPHFGDGATSEGDFHEAMTFAGVLDVPVVFLCHDNGWAISTPRERQTATPTIAEKAAAYGFDGVRVDGTDPLAVYDVVGDALASAREGGGPVLVEAVEYRFDAHTTADDPGAYRDGVPDYWRERDPLPRFEGFLQKTGRLDAEEAATVADRVDERIDEAIDRAEAVSADPEDMFDHVHAGDDPRLERQRRELRAVREARGDEAFRRE